MLHGQRGKANGVGLVLSGGGLSEERESIPEKVIGVVVED